MAPPAFDSTLEYTIRKWRTGLTFRTSAVVLRTDNRELRTPRTKCYHAKLISFHADQAHSPSSDRRACDCCGGSGYRPTPQARSSRSSTPVARSRRFLLHQLEM